jgi:hypothetical protein
MADNRPVILQAMKDEYFRRALLENRRTPDEDSYALDQLQDAIFYLQEEIKSENENPIPEATGIL